MTDNVAIWVSCGSVLISFASVVIALMAKRQARQAALLMSRAEAIANLRHVLGDLNRDWLASTKTMDRIQNALNLSHLVFSNSGKTSSRHTFLRAWCSRARTWKNGIVTLKEDLSKLIAQMNEEAALVRVPQERP